MTCKATTCKAIDGLFTQVSDNLFCSLVCVAYDSIALHVVRSILCYKFTQII